MDDYYDKTDELEAEAEFLLDDEQYERRSAAIRRISTRLNWNKIVAEQEERRTRAAAQMGYLHDAEECAA